MKSQPSKETKKNIYSKEELCNNPLFRILHELKCHPNLSKSIDVILVVVIVTIIYINLHIFKRRNLVQN